MRDFAEKSKSKRFEEEVIDAAPGRVIYRQIVDMASSLRAQGARPAVVKLPREQFDHLCTAIPGVRAARMVEGIRIEVCDPCKQEPRHADH